MKKKKMEYTTPMVETLNARMEKGFQSSGASFYGESGSGSGSGTGSNPSSNTDFGGGTTNNYGGAIFY